MHLYIQFIIVQNDYIITITIDYINSAFIIVVEQYKLWPPEKLGLAYVENSVAQCKGGQQLSTNNIVNYFCH